MAAEVNKPDFSFQWASGGAIVAPSDVKIQTGWTAEVPPFQWENFAQNRQDNAILHLFQKGISEWDAASNYYFTTSGVRSYVQGSDGNIYVAVADSLNQNPTTDATDTYWKLAFISPESVAADFPLRGVQTYQTPGTFAWVVPAGVTKVHVTVQGGGGGGGGANQAGAACGGGAGGYTEALVAVTPGASITVVVGGGGAGGLTTPTNGSSGGTSSFNGSISATGGTGGQLNLGGISTVVGVSGTGSGGYFNAQGGGAGQGYQVTGGYIGGPGAAPVFGSITIPNLGSAGSQGQGFGGGGAGSSANAVGGDGKSGFVVIKY